MALEDMGRTGQAMAFRNEANNNPMGALEIARGSEGLQPMSPGAMGGSVEMEEYAVDISRSPTPTEIKEGAFNAAFENLARRAGVDLVGPIKEVVQVAQLEDTPQNLPAQTGLIGKAM